MTDIRRRLVELPRGLGEISGGGVPPARVRYSLRVAQETMVLGAGVGIEPIPVRVLVSGQLTFLDGPPRLAIDRMYTLHMQDGRRLDFMPGEIDRTAGTVRIARVPAELTFIRLRSAV